MKKKVVVQLPRQANLKDLRVRYAVGSPRPTGL